MAIDFNRNISTMDIKLYLNYFVFNSILINLITYWYAVEYCFELCILRPALCNSLVWFMASQVVLFTLFVCCLYGGAKPVARFIGDALLKVTSVYVYSLCIYVYISLSFIAALPSLICLCSFRATNFYLQLVLWGLSVEDRGAESVITRSESGVYGCTFFDCGMVNLIQSLLTLLMGSVKKIFH